MTEPNKANRLAAGCMIMILRIDLRGRKRISRTANQAEESD